MICFDGQNLGFLTKHVADPAQLVLDDHELDAGAVGCFKNAHVTYKQKLKCEDPVQKAVQRWSEAAEEFLQDCLESVDWSNFTNAAANLDEYATAGTDFISKRLRKFAMFTRNLANFYECTIESILSGCITAWYGNCCSQHHKKLQKVTNTAQIIMVLMYFHVLFLPHFDSDFTLDP
eukprot:g41943.t1